MAEVVLGAAGKVSPEYQDPDPVPVEVVLVCMVGSLAASRVCLCFLKPGVVG